METDISTNTGEADEKVSRINSRGRELIKRCKKQEAIWANEANRLQKKVQTVTDEVASLITLKDADVQSLVDGKAYPIMPPLLLSSPSSPCSSDAGHTMGVH